MQKRMRRICKQWHPNKKTEVEMGVREKQEGCQRVRRGGESRGRSVRRCPEIQDVVIRQLEVKERE